MPDSGQSTLHTLTLTDNVDVGSDPAFAMKVDVSDPDGVRSVELKLSRPLLAVGDRENVVVSTWFSYDEWDLGEQSRTYQLNKINEAGAWVIDSVTIVDRLNNATELNTAQLRALGVDTGFTLSGTTPDRTAPGLQYLKFPTAIDTSKGPALWTMEARASDDASGAATVGITWDRPVNMAYSWYTGYPMPDSGAFFASKYPFVWAPDLERGAASSEWWISGPNGVYDVTAAWVYDKADNQLLVNQDTMRALGIPTQIVVNDGSFVAPALSADMITVPRTPDAGGAIVLRLSSDAWSSSANTVEMTIEYDATTARFDGWRAGSEGAYALSAQTQVVGVSGQTKISGTIDNKGDRSDFLDLHFKPSAGSGNFSFDLYGIKINGATLLESMDQSIAYRILAAVDGGAGADVLTGTGGDDYLRGLDGADLFIESAGTDTFAGGAGRDLARYASQRADYTVKREGADIVVASNYNATDIDRLQSVETIAFGDVRMEFDPNGHAAQIFRLFQAAFDRAPKATGLGFWVKAAESGVSMHRIASDFVASDEFKTLHAKDPSHAAIVDSFYRNALDRAPDLQGFQAWTGLLERKELDVAQVLQGFSESRENRDNTAELIGQGLTYLPL